VRKDVRWGWREETEVTEPLWRGVGVALVTLFDADGKVAVSATAEHAARLVSLGIRAVLVAGSTGEADALTDAEREDLIAAVKRVCGGVPVIAGASGAWSRPAAERTAAAVAAGADAVLVAPPRRAGDTIAFFAAVGEAAGRAPVLAYHFPGVAGGEVPLDLLPQLPVAGMKDSTGDPERLLRELDAWDAWTYVGAATMAAFAGTVGAAGAILAVANAVPEECLAAWDGDGAAQRRLTTAHVAARTRFPYGLKELVAKRFDTATHARLG